MLFPTVIIPNLPSCSEPRRLAGFSVQYACRGSAGDQPAPKLGKFHESFVSTALGGGVFHVAGSKDEGFYFRSKETVPEHKVQGNQVKLRLRKTAESSRLWWILSPAVLLRHPSKKDGSCIISFISIYQDNGSSLWYASLSRVLISREMLGRWFDGRIFQGL